MHSCGLDPPRAGLTPVSAGTYASLRSCSPRGIITTVTAVDCLAALTSPRHDRGGNGARGTTFYTTARPPSSFSAAGLCVLDRFVLVARSLSWYPVRDSLQGER